MLEVLDIPREMLPEVRRPATVVTNTGACATTCGPISGDRW